MSLAPYARARAALEPYTRMLHRALAPDGVTVTTGYVEVGGRMAIEEAAAALAGSIERRAQWVHIPRRQATTGSPRGTSRS